MDKPTDPADERPGIKAAQYRLRIETIAIVKAEALTRGIGPSEIIEQAVDAFCSPTVKTFVRRAQNELATAS